MWHFRKAKAWLMLQTDQDFDIYADLQGAAVGHFCYLFKKLMQQI